MKKSILLTFSFGLLVSFFALGQTIRRVNNNVGVTGINMYTTIQAAHDAAVAGDIIMIEPTSVSGSYGSLVVTKQINIVSNGYFLDKNPNIGPPFDTRRPYIDNLSFNAGSTNSTMTGVFVSGPTVFRCENISVTQCRFASISFLSTAASGPNGNNVSITKCLIEGQLTAQNGCSNCGYNITVSNNIITTVFSYIAQGFSNSVFNSNTIIPSSYGQFGSAFANFNGCVVSNNIFDFRNWTSTANPITAGSSGTTYSNNICIGITALPAGNGNVNNASSTNFFVAPNTPLANLSGTGDAVFQLSVTSPALTVASDGGQAGAFGNGGNSYKLSGLPPYPIITNFTTSGTGNSTTPLSVSVTVRGNN